MSYDIGRSGICLVSSSRELAYGRDIRLPETEETSRTLLSQLAAFCNTLMMAVLLRI
jgi:hypothetical protein